MLDYEARKELNSQFLRYYQNYTMGETIRRMLPEKILTGREIKEKWKKSIPNARKRLAFYTHIPYCLKRCSFCMYVSEELKDPNAVSNYVDALTKRYDYYSDVFTGKTFSSLYFGGGTPNILSDNDIDKLFTSLYKNYSFSESGERTFEGNPIFATPSKLKLLHEFGINRVSFGVQSFDNLILQKNNRAVQNFSLIEKAVKSAQDAGIQVVNLDLIMGFAEETVDDFVESFRRALTLDATKISVYPIQQTSKYLDTFFKGDTNRFTDYRRNFITKAIPGIEEVLRDSNFFSINLKEIFDLPGDGNCISFTNKSKIDFKDDETYFFDSPISPTITFGNGISAMSGAMLFGFCSFCRKFGENPGDDIHEAVIMEEKETMANYLFKAFSSEKKMKLSKFKDTFEKEITNVFKDELELLVSHGRVRITDEEMILSAEDPKERAEICLFFTDEDLINRAIAKYIADHKNLDRKNNDQPKIKEAFKEEYLEHSGEIFKKMNSLINPVSIYIYDGEIKSISEDRREAVLIGRNNNETKIVKVSDQLLIVEQYILEDGDEAEKNIWREIDFKYLFDQQDKDLSCFINKETDEVLVVKKIIPLY